jgi:hypothetical protein
MGDNTREVSCSRPVWVRQLTLLGFNQGTRCTETALFLTTQKPYYRQVSRDTIAQWVRTVLRAAGLDKHVFQPHSIPSAATSRDFVKTCSCRQH